MPIHKVDRCGASELQDVRGFAALRSYFPTRIYQLQIPTTDSLESQHKLRLAIKPILKHLLSGKP